MMKSLTNVASLFAILSVLAACNEQEALRPVDANQPHYEVLIDPKLDESVIEAAVAGVDWLNTRLGERVLVPVVADPGQPKDWRVRVMVGDPTSNFIGFSVTRNRRVDIYLRRDALDWSTFAHEMLHGLSLDHVDDVNNLMFEDYNGSDVFIEDWQVEQAMSYVYRCDWRIDTHECLKEAK